MRIKAPISYYGGKSKIAHLYPAPVHDLIIEPFAGSAAYSWLHRRRADGTRRQVWLNDLDEKTYSIWSFLTQADALDIVERFVPDTVVAGQKVSDLIPSDLPGLVEICRAEANQGTQGAKGVHDQITSMGAKCWKVKRKLREVIPEVCDWRVTQWGYGDVNRQLRLTDLMNLGDGAVIPEANSPMTATWFIDPPYANEAGKRYRQGGLDYATLSTYCKTRKGQVIVCENYGADWLPFERFNHQRTSIRSRYQKANAQEVMYYKESQ
jgi:hypothetical protein